MDTATKTENDGGKQGNEGIAHRFLPASLAPKKGRPPMARFPDLRVTARSPSSRTCVSSDCQSTVRRSLFGVRTDEVRRTQDDGRENALTAYSGGTVWALHPLRVAAG